MTQRKDRVTAETLSRERLRTLLRVAERKRVLVVGDLMLDQFIWGRVSRISPEAPVPVVEFERESLMPGGAANVARNLAALGAQARLAGLTGRDAAARDLRSLLRDQRVDCAGVVADRTRMTTCKVRIIAQRQQVVRVDRESPGCLNGDAAKRLRGYLDEVLPEVDAVIVGDYGKGVVTQSLLDDLGARCRARGVWLSLDPKPVHDLDLSGLSLITPNRKEVFELAGMKDGSSGLSPLGDQGLLQAGARVFERFRPALLLVTLGEQGMLLCRRDAAPFHIPTVAREVFDVSGAGDTVVACFTLAVAAGASPTEAAIISNHAAGVVVGKVGTAVVTPEELMGSFCG